MIHSNPRTEAYCLICGPTVGYKPISEFYKRGKDKVRPQSYCKGCFHVYQMMRWNQRKVRAIEYLGGKCTNPKCPIRGPVHPAAFDFHHRDKSTKEFEWGKIKMRSWAKIVKELDKCDLLCAYCHRLQEVIEALWKQGRQDSNLRPAL